MENNIHANSLLVSLHISQWLPFAHDKKISKRVTAEHSAVSNACSVRKKLFPDHTFPQLETLLSTLNALYVWHAMHSLVWDGNGTRLLPAVTAAEHKTRVDNVIEALPGMIDSVVYGMPQAILRAQEKLGAMFRESDYPTAQELRGKFSVTAEYNAIPALLSSGTLPDGITSMLNEQIEQRIASNVDNTLTDAWQRLYTVVDRLQKKLATPAAIFRDSLVTNVLECCDVLKRLNVTGNEQLDAMRIRAENEIAKFDPDTIRDNDNLRFDIAVAADGLLTEIKATRKIVTLAEFETAND